MRRAALFLAMTASVTALPVPPAPAQESWSRTVASEPRALEINSFLFTRSGHGVALWRGGDPTRPVLAPALSLGSIAGQWRRGPDLSAFTPAPVEAFAYARSRLLLVGLQPNGTSGQRVRQAIVVAYGTATDGSVGEPRRLAADAGGAVTAVNASGDALVAWGARAGMRVAERAAGRAFGRGHVRTPRSPSRPAVAINARGDRVLAWYRKGYVEARIRRRGHSWGRVVRISRADPLPERLEATIGTNGRVLVAWGATLIRAERPMLADVRVAIRDDGRWTAWRLERLPTPAPFPAEPRAIPVIDSRGLAWIAWTGLMNGQPVVKLARIGGRTVLAPVAVSPPGAGLEDAVPGLRGDLALTWSAPHATGSATYVLQRSASGALGPAVALTGPGEASFGRSQIAFDPLDARPSVAWLLRSETQGWLIVSTGPAPPAP